MAVKKGGGKKAGGKPMGGKKPMPMKGGHMMTPAERKKMKKGM